MKDVIEILRQQIVLCTRLMELIKEQRPEIIGGRAKEASALASAMEPLMTKLMALEKKQKQLLFTLRAKDISTWLADQPESKEQAMAMLLLEKQQKLTAALKEESAVNRQFLDRNIKFIDYSVNVMTQTAAGVTYGTPEGNGGRPVQGQKMFDANI